MNPMADVIDNDIAKSRDTSTLDLIMLSDDDEPVPYPKNDKFNLAN